MIANNNNKHLNPYELQPDLLQVLLNDHHNGDDDDDVKTIIGLTRASVLVENYGGWGEDWIQC
jgi:hypothetical protein